MTKPTCAVNVVFTVKAEHMAAFREAVLRQAKNSLDKEAWCHQFDVGFDPERPNMVMLYETYDDRAAFFDKHRSTEHFADFGRTIADWVEAKQLNIWDIG